MWYIVRLMSIKRKIRNLKYSAKSRGLEVRLMDYEYENLLNLGCHYCGKNILEENGYCLDRIDSDKGYTLYNSVGCCKICNRAKFNMSFDQFVDWIEKAYKFQQNIMEMLKKDNTDYNYKEEKDLHKLTKTDESFIIKNK